MVGHRVTSPLLLGIRSEGGGLGSNADEIKNSQLLFTNLVIKPYQDIIIDAIDELLAHCGISLNLYFKPIQPLEFMEVEIEDMDDETKEEETGVKEELSKSGYTDEETALLLDNLEGEIVDDSEWVMADVRLYDDENKEPQEEWAKKHISENLNMAQKLARAITSKPSKESYLDKSIYKVRYRYEGPSAQREFCKIMMQRTRNGVVYRLEDIDKASRAGVNIKFGHKGQPYDLFKYKGGPYCKHFWTEVLYRLKKKTDGSYYEDKALSSSEQVDSIPKSYKPRPAGHKKAPVAPADMPYGGHHPDYVNKYMK